MAAVERFMEDTLDRVSLSDFRKIAATVVREDSAEDTWDTEGKEVVDELISSDGQSTTLGIWLRTGPLGVPNFYYFTAIAAPFLIRSVEDKRTAKVLVSYFLSRAKSACADLRGRFSRKADWSLFYLVTNLASEPLRRLDADGYFTSLLDEARENLRVDHPINIGSIGVFERDAIVATAMAHEPVRQCIINVGKTYGRLVIQFDDSSGKIHVKKSILAGCECVSVGQDTDILSKISVPQSFSEEVIEHLESLLNSSATKENDIQRFFEEHPELLMMDEYAHIYSRVSLVREHAPTLRPDFILEPASGPLCTILDLKLPYERIFVRRKNRKRFSAKIHEYAAQLREYGNYFDSYSQRRWFKRQYGLDAFRPRLIMVVGKDYNADDLQLLGQLRHTLNPVELISYDDIIAKYGTHAFPTDA